MTDNAKDGMASATDSPITARLLSRPLDTLVFVLPFILFYEIGCFVIRAHGEPGQRVVAFDLMRYFFELFGSTGVWMPGFAVVIILLATHMVSGREWTIHRRAVGWMYAESAALAAPLLLFNLVLSASPQHWTARRHLYAEAVLGIGAGVYEELVFRLVLISIIVIIGTDLLRFSSRATLIFAVIFSALIFSAHHHPPLGSDPFSLRSFIFRTIAGLYLGALFVYRGYGPAAGTHAIYNLLVIVL